MRSVRMRLIGAAIVLLSGRFMNFLVKSIYFAENGTALDSGDRIIAQFGG